MSKGKHGRRRGEGERGQVLLLFVGLFSVVLILGAYAIDQGFWYGRHRHTQVAADAAARAGAFRFLNDIDDDSAAMNSACIAAREVAGLNNIDVTSDSTCPVTGADAETRFNANDDCFNWGDNIRSVTAQVNVPTGALFGKVFGLLSVDIGARSEACVGAVRKMVTAEAPGVAGEAIPVAIRYGVSDSEDCVNSGNLVLGSHCSLVTDRNNDDVTFERPTSGTCEGTSGSGPIHDAIRDGIDFTCDADASCSGPTSLGCVEERSISASTLIDAFHDRLARGNSCGGAGGGNSISDSALRPEFRAAFAKAGGQPWSGGSSAGPASLGGTSNTDTVYRQNPCFSPRVAMTVLTDDDTEEVEGYATVFILGCSWPSIRIDRFTVIPSGSDKNCNLPGNLPGDEMDEVHVRAILVRTYIPDGQGRLGDVDESLALTLQTVTD